MIEPEKKPDRLKRGFLGFLGGSAVSLFVILPAYCSMMGQSRTFMGDSGPVLDEGAKVMLASPQVLRVAPNLALKLQEAHWVAGYAKPGNNEVLSAHHGRFLSLRFTWMLEGNGLAPRPKLPALDLAQDLRLEACGTARGLSEDLMPALNGPWDVDRPMPSALPMGESDFDLVFDVGAWCSHFQLSLRLGQPKSWHRISIQAPPWRWFWQRRSERP